MKKTITLLSAALTAGCLFAQTVPNSGFETWTNNNETMTTYSVPQGWVTGDIYYTALANLGGDATYNVHSVTQTSSAHGGSSAVHMSVDVSSAGDTISGLVYSAPTLANLSNVLTQTGMSGFPMTGRPANLNGYYKLSGNNSETGACAILITKWNTATNTRDTLYFNENLFITVNTNTWTQFSFPLTYAFAENPDSMLIGFGLINMTGTYNLASTFDIDDLTLTGNVPIGIDEHSSAIPAATLFPNPVSTTATLSLPGTSFHNATLNVYDVNGQLVSHTEGENGDVIYFNREALPAGMYFYSIRQENAVLAKGTMMVSGE